MYWLLADVAIISKTGYVPYASDYFVWSLAVRYCHGFSGFKCVLHVYALAEHTTSI